MAMIVAIVMKTMVHLDLWREVFGALGHGHGHGALGNCVLEFHDVIYTMLKIQIFPTSSKRGLSTAGVEPATFRSEV
jgi:hypothetical protein